MYMAIVVALIHSRIHDDKNGCAEEIVCDFLKRDYFRRYLSHENKTSNVESLMKRPF